MQENANLPLFNVWYREKKYQYELWVNFSQKTICYRYLGIRPHLISGNLLFRLAGIQCFSIYYRYLPIWDGDAQPKYPALVGWGVRAKDGGLQSVHTVLNLPKKDYNHMQFKHDIQKKKKSTQAVMRIWIWIMLLKKKKNRIRTRLHVFRRKFPNSVSSNKIKTHENCQNYYVQFFWSKILL